MTKHPVADAESRDLQERELIKTAALTRGVTEALCHRRVNALQASLTAYAGVGVFITAYDRWIDQDGARTWAGWSTSPCTSFDAQSALRTG